MLFEERGYFWSGEEPIPQGQFAPNSAIPGLLKIDDDGSALIQLDGILPLKDLPQEQEISLPANKYVYGVLKYATKRVMLFDLIRTDLRSNGISSESYTAWTSFVAEHDGFVRPDSQFTHLTVPFSGYENWLRLQPITIRRTKRTVAAKYKKPRKAVYAVSNGSLTIDFDVEGNAGRVSASMRATASAAFRWRRPLSFSDVKAEYQSFADLLLLFTQADRPPDWPIVRSENLTFRLYFKRFMKTPAPASLQIIDIAVHFSQIRGRLGSIWKNWKNKGEKLGSGLYLYLGTRRGFPMYVEHRFVNLIWGIELLHRKWPTPEAPTKLQQKIDRILRDTKLARDKKWLEQKLEYANEPTLESRIYDVLNATPLGLDKEQLRKFSARCARLRNDISHFGGSGGSRDTKASYNDFAAELSNKGEVLAILFQIFLLREIGIPSNS